MVSLTAKNAAGMKPPLADDEDEPLALEPAPNLEDVTAAAGPGVLPPPPQADNKRVPTRINAPHPELALPPTRASLSVPCEIPTLRAHDILILL